MGIPSKKDSLIGILSWSKPLLGFRVEGFRFWVEVEGLFSV